LFKLTKQFRKWNRENFEESTDSIGAEDASSKRLIGEATRWNPRGFGFIKPSDGSEDLFCLLSSIADGNELREGEMVEYEAEYDDRRGKYRAIKVTRKAARNTRKKRTKLPPPGGGGGRGGGGYGHWGSRMESYSSYYSPPSPRSSANWMADESYIPTSPSFLRSPPRIAGFGDIPSSPPYIPTSPPYIPTVYPHLDRRGYVGGGGGGSYGGGPPKCDCYATSGCATPERSRSCERSRSTSSEM